MNHWNSKYAEVKNSRSHHRTDATSARSEQAQQLPNEAEELQRAPSSLKFPCSLLCHYSWTSTTAVTLTEGDKENRGLINSFK